MQHQDQLERMKSITNPQTAFEIAEAMKDPNSPIAKKVWDQILANVAIDIILLQIMAECIRLNTKLDEETRNAIAERALEDQLYREKQQQELQAAVKPSDLTDIDLGADKDKYDQLHGELDKAKEDLVQKQVDFQNAINEEKKEFMEGIKNASAEEMKIYGLQDSAGNPIDVPREQVEAMMEKAVTRSANNAIPALDAFMESRSQVEMQRPPEERVLTEIEVDLADPGASQAALPSLDPKSVNAHQHLNTQINLLGELSKLTDSESIGPNILKIVMENKKKGVIGLMDKLQEKGAENKESIISEFLQTKDKVIEKTIALYDLVKEHQPREEQVERFHPRPGTSN